MIRETREETAWRFTPDSLIGVYLYPHRSKDITYLRFCFAGRCDDHKPAQALDDGIQRAVWLSRDELVQRKQQLRSPMVLRCIDDYLAGKCYPLSILNHYARDGVLL